LVHLRPLDRARLQRSVEHLHRLGVRTEAEFLAEVGQRIGGMPAILGLLSEYESRLSPEMIRATGADKLSRRQLHSI
jgi:hypothetical protein